MVLDCRIQIQTLSNVVEASKTLSGFAGGTPWHRQQKDGPCLKRSGCCTKGTKCGPFKDPDIIDTWSHSAPFLSNHDFGGVAAVEGYESQPGCSTP